MFRKANCKCKSVSLALPSTERKISFSAIERKKKKKKLFHRRSQFLETGDTWAHTSGPQVKHWFLLKFSKDGNYNW